MWKWRKKEISSDVRDEKCKVEEERKSHVKDVDPGLWPADLTDKDREAIVRSLAATDDDGVLPRDSEGKLFPEYLLYSKAANGREKVKRDWVTYSKTTNALYCIPCVLFSYLQKRSSLSALNSQNGYKMSDVKWCQMYNKFTVHEKIGHTKTATLSGRTCNNQ